MAAPPIHGERGGKNPPSQVYLIGGNDVDTNDPSVKRTIVRAAEDQPKERSIDDLYNQQKGALIRAKTAESQDLGEILLIISVVLQIAAALAGLMGSFLTRFPIEIVVFVDFLSIMLCIVIIVLATLAIARRSVGYAYAAGLLGIFVGGPFLVTTVASLISLALAGLSERA